MHAHVLLAWLGLVLILLPVALVAAEDVHAPPEAPDRFLEPYSIEIHPPRRKGLSQISAVDEGASPSTCPPYELTCLHHMSNCLRLVTSP